MRKETTQTMEKYQKQMSSSRDGDEGRKSEETGPWGKYSPMGRIKYFESMFVSENP